MLQSFLTSLDKRGLCTIGIGNSSNIGKTVSGRSCKMSRAPSQASAHLATLKSTIFYKFWGKFWTHVQNRKIRYRSLSKIEEGKSFEHPDQDKCLGGGLTLNLVDLQDNSQLSINSNLWSQNLWNNTFLRIENIFKNLHLKLRAKISTWNIHLKVGDRTCTLKN